MKDCETVSLSLSVLRRQDASSRGIKLFSTFIAAAADTQTTNCQLVDERQQQQQQEL